MTSAMVQYNSRLSVCLSVCLSVTRSPDLQFSGSELSDLLTPTALFRQPPFLSHSTSKPLFLKTSMPSSVLKNVISPLFKKSTLDKDELSRLLTTA